MERRIRVQARDLRPGDVLGRDPATGEETLVEAITRIRGKIIADTSTREAEVYDPDEKVRIARFEERV